MIFVLYSLFVYFSLEEKTRNLFYCVVFSILDKISFLVHLFLIWSHAVKEWLSVLLPLALDRGVCIITNMGAGKTLQTIVWYCLICSFACLDNVCAFGIYQWIHLELKKKFWSWHLIWDWK